MSLALVASKQEEIFRDAVSTSSTRNFIIMGPGGCGKTHLLKRIAHYFRGKGLNTWVVAPTGVSAFNCNGRTIHSAFGIDPFSEKLKNTPTHFTILPDVLIIDEISMVSQKLLTLMNNILVANSRLKLSGRPRIVNTDDLFAGRQVIIFGDFYQLPPVIKEERDKYYLNGANEKELNGYAFGAKIWARLKLKCYQLSEGVRQTDKQLVEWLLHVRRGDIPLSFAHALQRRLLTKPLCQQKWRDNVWPTVLYGTRRKSNAFNAFMFSRLESRVFTITSQIVWRRKERGAIIAQPTFEMKNFSKYWFESVGIEPVYDIRLGAMVMLRLNVDAPGGLYNGLSGCVTRLTCSCGLVETSEPSDPNETNETNDTSHKDGHEKGYRQDNNDKNSEKNSEKKKTHTDTCQIISICICDSSGRLNTINTVNYVRPFKDNIFMTYTGLPFCSSWAMTIHKSQGLTLNAAALCLDSDNIFLPSQAYVALSRIRNLDGLFLESLDLSTIWVDKRVVEFYKNISDTFKQDMCDNENDENDENDELENNEGIIIDDDNKDETKDDLYYDFDCLFDQDNYCPLRIVALRSSNDQFDFLYDCEPPTKRKNESALPLRRRDYVARFPPNNKCLIGSCGLDPVKWVPYFSCRSCRSFNFSDFFKFVTTLVVEFHGSEYPHRVFLSSQHKKKYSVRAHTHNLLLSGHSASFFSHIEWENACRITIWTKCI